MGLRDAFDWFVHNVRTTDVQQPVHVDLERNREAAVEMGARNPPDMPLYRFSLGVRAGFSGEAEACIPVYKRVNPHPHPVLKEIFYCEVAGTTLEAANVHALRKKVASMLETLAPAGSLPLAYFRVPELDYSLPVYEEGGKIICPVIAGPRLKAKDLATMRGHVYRYLFNAGYVSDQSHLEIQVVRPSDLRLVPPAAILSSLDDPELWFATVEGRSPEGLVIGLLGESTELEPQERERAGVQQVSAPPAATDVASLLRLVGNELVEAGRVEDPFALYAREVRPEIWSRTEAVTDDAGHRLECWLEGETDEPAKLELPLRRTAAGELVTALEDQGICVFVAGAEAALAQKVGRYLSDQGFLRWEEAIEVVAPEPLAAAAGADVRGGGGDRIVSGEEIRFPRLEFDPRPPQAASETDAEGFETPDEQEEPKEEVGLP
jgi:hypothetical protein